MRELVLAALTATAYGTVAYGLGLVYAPLGWVAGGTLLGAWAWQVLGDN